MLKIAGNNKTILCGQKLIYIVNKNRCIMIMIKILDDIRILHYIIVKED